MTTEQLLSRSSLPSRKDAKDIKIFYSHRKILRGIPSSNIAGTL